MFVTELNSVNDFQNIITADLSVVLFFAPWAEQCMQMNNVLKQMAELSKFENVKFASVKAESFPEISMKYDISAVPVTLLFKDGTVTARVEGVDPVEVQEQIKKKLIPDKNVVMKSEDLEKKLNKLTNQAHCMLFMKGNKDTPRCGFSRSIVCLLDHHDIQYETYDVLEDYCVREGLKKLSNWPTYPQLYIKGKFIGGLDIVKELSKSGDLDIMATKNYKNLSDKLKKLINQATCMVFMKGNRKVPRCGFSKAIIAILDEHSADYQTFDILEDNEVRTGLKKYSNWPTYPQLYIDGKLIGGLDIITEMKKSGNLKDKLPQKLM